METAACLVQEGPVDPDYRIAMEVVKGNEQAYGQLVERYWGRIFARVYQLLGNREDAEEITQDAFTRALENLGNFRWEASFSTWLYQIASNLARNRFWYWKRRRRERCLPLETPINVEGRSLGEILPDDTVDPGNRLCWNEFHQTVENELERLSGRHREVMAMRLLEELSYEEISERLQIPIGTVKSRIARARYYLGKAVGISGKENTQAYFTQLARLRS